MLTTEPGGAGATPCSSRGDPLPPRTRTRKLPRVTIPVSRSIAAASADTELTNVAPPPRVHRDVSLM